MKLSLRLARRRLACSVDVMQIRFVNIEAGVDKYSCN